MMCASLGRAPASSAAASPRENRTPVLTMEPMRVGGWAKWWATALAVATTLIVAAPASATLTLQPAFTGGTVDLPMMVTSPPGDSHRLFIVTRTGQIYVAVDGVLQSQPFLDISSQVWTARGEAAMGSMAFDPGYLDAQSPGYGRFYVDYVGPPAQGDKSGPVHI